VLLVCIGRKPNTEASSRKSRREARRKRPHRHHDHYRHKRQRIYAIGDVIKGPMSRTRRGRGHCDCELLRQAGHVNYDVIPKCRLHIARSGKRRQDEEELRTSGVDYTAGKFRSWQTAVPRHRTDGRFREKC